MFAVKPSPLEASLHGNARRRVWAFPDAQSHSLVVLTFNALHLAPRAGEPKPGTVAALEGGADLDEILGPLATTVELTAVRRVELDLLTNSLVLQYVGPAWASARLVVRFATHDAADACFTKVWRRLGDAFKLQPYRRDTWALARGPVTMLLGVLAGTLLLALLAGGFDSYAAARAAGHVSVAGAAGLEPRADVPASTLGAAVGWLNWKAVCGVGGVLAAVSQVWLYRRLTSPPASLEIVRG